MRLQSGAGNAAVSRLLARGPARSSGPTTGNRPGPGPARAVEAGTSGTSETESTPSVDDGADRGIASVQRLGTAAPPSGGRPPVPVSAGTATDVGTPLATPVDSDGASGVGGSSPAPLPAPSLEASHRGSTAPAEPAQASGDLGPLSALGGLRDARPSAFAQQLAGVAGLVPPALAGEQSAGALPGRSAPTGLAPEAPVALPAGPTIGDQAAPAVAPRGGDPDPGAADQWAEGGTAAVHRAAAEGAAPAPRPGAALSPDVAPVALPEVTLPAVGTVGTAPAGPAPANAQEAAALNAAAGAPVHQLVGRLLAPASAAGAAHRAEAAQARAATQTEIADLGTDASARQQAVRASADQEVQHEHALWTTSRETIVREHTAGISSIAGGTKTEISRTVAQADAQAAAQHAAEGGDSASRGGLWDRFKRGASAVAGAVKGAASAVGGAVAGIVAAARSHVTGLLTRLASTVRERVSAAVATLRATATRVWRAMRAAADRAREAITRLARAAMDAARRLWTAVAARLKQSWGRLLAAAKSAFAAAVEVVRKIGAALTKIKEILKLLASPLVRFIIDAYGDVRKKIVDPLVAKAAPLLGKVPGTAADLVRQQSGTPGVQPRIPLQRAPSTTETAAVDFSAAVDSQVKADAASFSDHWLLTLVNVISQLIWPTGIFTEEFPGLWEELKGVWSPAPGLDRLDHFLGIARRLTNIVNGALAFIGIWAALIAMAGGPVAEFVTVGTYYAVSMAMIQVDLGLALAQLLKYWLSGTRGGATTAEVSQYARMYAKTGIGAVVTAVLVVLGMVASRFANRIKALLPERPVEPVRKGAAPREEKPAVPEEKPAEPVAAEIPGKPGLATDVAGSRRFADRIRTLLDKIERPYARPKLEARLKAAEESLTRIDGELQNAKSAAEVDRLRAERDAVQEDLKKLNEEVRAAATRFPKSWADFDERFHTEFEGELRKFRGSDDLAPNSGLRGGEGQLFLGKERLQALKRWFTSRLGDMGESIRLLREARSGVQANGRLSAVVEVVEVSRTGSDWALRGFDPNSVPLKSALGDSRASAARLEAIAALETPPNATMQLVKDKLLGNSANLHWSPAKGKILIIDMQ
jgi:hypothetical protein